MSSHFNEMNEDSLKKILPTEIRKIISISSRGDKAASITERLSVDNELNLKILKIP